MTIDYSKLAFIDTETLGLDADLHPVWEIAVIVGPEEHDRHCWQVEVRDIDMNRADPIALDINGFHGRYDPDATLTPRRAIERLHTLTAGRHLVGAVVSFDEERLRRMSRIHLPAVHTMPWHYHLIDVESMMVGALAQRGVYLDPPWKSTALAAQFGVTPQTEAEHHTALGDALWAQRCFEAVMSREPF